MTQNSKKLNHSDYKENSENNLVTNPSKKKPQIGKKMFRGFVNKSSSDLQDAFKSAPHPFNQKNKEFATLKQLQQDTAPVFTGKQAYFFPKKQKEQSNAQQAEEINDNQQNSQQQEIQNPHQQKFKILEDQRQKITDMREYDKQIRDKIIKREMENEHILRNISKNAKEENNQQKQLCKENFQDPSFSLKKEISPKSQLNQLDNQLFQQNQQELANKSIQEGNYRNKKYVPSALNIERDKSTSLMRQKISRSKQQSPLERNVLYTERQQSPLDQNAFYSSLNQNQLRKNSFYNAKSPTPVKVNQNVSFGD